MWVVVPRQLKTSLDRRHYSVAKFFQVLLLSSMFGQSLSHLVSRGAFCTNSFIFKSAFPCSANKLIGSRITNYDSSFVKRCYGSKCITSRRRTRCQYPTKTHLLSSSQEQSSSNHMAREYSKLQTETELEQEHNVNISDMGRNDEINSTIIEGKHYGSHNWKEHPSLNPTVIFRSWIVPVSGKSLQAIVGSTWAQEYLASRLDLLEHVHQRLKLIKDIPNSSDKRYKLVLLHPDAPKIQDLPHEVRQLLLESNIEDGPDYSVSFSATQFTASYILSTILPKSVHPVPTAFETIGHVAHLNLKQHHVPYGSLIGAVLLETLPAIETVIHKVGDVSGPFRTYSLQVLAGRPDTSVQLTESGIQMQFDLADVYWCSRLSEERTRLLSAEIAPYSIVADAFCGVGAVCLRAAKQLNCSIWANDWNPDAIESLKVNAIKNGVNDNFKIIQCGDAYDFLMDLGLKEERPAEQVSNGKSEGGSYRLPDHVILNFPLESARFLGALRWWPVAKTDDGDSCAGNKVSPRVHVYTFARADEATNRSAEEVAVDLVASNLLPIMSAGGSEGDVTSNIDPTINRWVELNEEYSCHISVHTVRDVAPGKVVVCVSFSATPKLLRHMQGDF